MRLPVGRQGTVRKRRWHEWKGKAVRPAFRRIVLRKGRTVADECDVELLARLNDLEQLRLDREKRALDLDGDDRSHLGKTSAIREDQPDGCELGSLGK